MRIVPLYDPRNCFILHECRRIPPLTRNHPHRRQETVVVVILVEGIHPPIPNHDPLQVEGGVFEDQLGDGGNVVAGEALARNVQWVLPESQLIVVEVGEEVEEVLGRIQTVVDPPRLSVVAETDVEGLVGAEEVAVHAPTPHRLHHFVAAFGPVDEERTQLVEAAELRSAAWTTLQPNYYRSSGVGQWHTGGLPKGIIHRCSAHREVPIYVLVPTETTELQHRRCLL